MGTIEKSIEVNVPVSTAYNQWTQFESFPRFMEGVKEIVQLDETHLRWNVKIAGQEREWISEIVEQIPDQRIAWRSVGETDNGGVVTFHYIDENTTRVMLQLDWDAEKFTDKVADFLGIASSRAQGDLERFKEFIESRRTETGAWRGKVEDGQTEEAETDMPMPSIAEETTRRRPL